MTEDTLKEQLKREARVAPENPMFTRKVMNRLPERQHTRLGWLISLAYAVGALGLIIYWALFFMGSLHDHSFANFCCLAAFTVGYAVLIILDPLRASLRSIFSGN